MRNQIGDKITDPARKSVNELIAAVEKQQNLFLKNAQKDPRLIENLTSDTIFTDSYWGLLSRYGDMSRVSNNKFVKTLLKEGKVWERNFGEPLPTLQDVIWDNMNEEEKKIHLKKMNEAESMKLQPKGGGKTVIFKDKDNYEKAKKSGDYEDPKGLGDDDKEEPSGKLGGGDFEREPDDSEFGYEDDEEAQAQAEKDMEDEFGDMDMEEESISINGKKYREVKEEKKVVKKHILREMFERISKK